MPHFVCVQIAGKVRHDGFKNSTGDSSGQSEPRNTGLCLQFSQTVLRIKVKDECFWDFLLKQKLSSQNKSHEECSLYLERAITDCP